METEFADDGTRYFAWQYSGATDDILFMKDISPLPTASVKNESNGSAITPNPVRSGSSISIYGATTSLTYTIVDVLGRNIYSGSLAILDNYSVASIPKIPAGQYFLQTGSEIYSIVVTD